MLRDMAGKDKLSWLNTRWAFVERFGALPVIGAALAGVFAWASDAMAQWAPFSWFAAAALGALVFQLFALSRATWAERKAREQRIQQLQTPKSSINPLADTFERQRIFITDLLPPVSTTIEGKTFIECELIGPAVIMGIGSGKRSAQMSNCDFFIADGVILDSAVTHINNVIVFKDCQLLKCKLYKITLLLQPDSVRGNLPEIHGMNWLTALPSVEAKKS